MQSEIQGELLLAKKEAKNVRTNKGVHTVIIILFAVLFYLIPYSSTPSLDALYAIDALIILLGAFYILFSALPSIVYPLPTEKRAFIQISKAIDVLCKSKNPVAYEEALKHLVRADRILDGQYIDASKWYEKINNRILEFRSNLKFIILPSTERLKVKVEHLEEMALALSKREPERIIAINQKIGTEPTYERVQLQPQKPLLTMLKENKFAKIGCSLGLGYIVIAGICAIYVFSTGQDFLTFVRANPTIVILGGLGISGITFWKT